MLCQCLHCEPFLHEYQFSDVCRREARAKDTKTEQRTDEDRRVRTHAPLRPEGATGRGLHRLRRWHALKAWPDTDMRDI